MRVRLKFVALVALVLISLSAEARPGRRAKAKVPLMPPRYELASVTGNMPEAIPELTEEGETTPVETPAFATSPSTLPDVGYGLELGVLGRSAQSTVSLDNTQILFGGRIFADVPLFENFSLRPAVGYFMRRHRDTGVDAFQNEIELGLAALYNVFEGPSAQFGMGAAARLSGSFNYLMSAGETAPLEYKPRFGPLISIGLRMTDECDFVINAEGGLETFRSTRPYGTLTGGFLFRLK